MDSSYRDFKQWSWPSLQPNPDGVAWPTAPCVTQQVYIVLETWVTMTGVIENCLVPNGSMKIPSHQQLLRYVPVNSRFQVLISRTIPLARTFSLLQTGSLHERLGNVPEGQEKKSDDIIQKLKLIYILSFQGPTASFAIQQGVFFISCDRFM